MNFRLVTLIFVILIVSEFGCARFTKKGAEGFLKQVIERAESGLDMDDDLCLNESVVEDCKYVFSSFGKVERVEFVDYYLGHYTFDLFFSSERVASVDVSETKVKGSRFYKLVGFNF